MPPKKTKKAFAPERKVGAHLAKRAEENGLIIRAMGDNIGFCPPLVIEPAQIDEMFAQKDGFSEVTVEQHLTALRSLISMEDEDEAFRAKYQAGLQQDLDAAAHQGDLRKLLFG